MTCRFLCILLLCAAPLGAAADDRLVRLAAPEALVDTGVFRNILPRFTLKTRVRVELVGLDEGADAALGRAGRPMFDALGKTWRMEVLSPDHPGTERFRDWLASDVGQRTLAAYSAPSGATFGPPTVAEAEVEEGEMTGDAVLGHAVSRAKCTRCHAVDEATAGAAFGSTPSFGVLRALGDWEYRFSAFYALNPHPSFTIITDLTEPFPEDRPPPIVPIELTLEEVEAVTAYVAAMPAADLGAPIQSK